MRLTTKYTFYILLVFVGIFTATFYVLDVKRQEKMLELSSTILMANVDSIVDVAKYEIENVPHILMMLMQNPRMEEMYRPDWLTPDSTGMYITGYGTGVEVYVGSVVDGGKYYLTLSGFFGEFTFNAEIDFEEFMNGLIEKKKRFGYFYVVDENGDVLYHTISERRGLNMKEEGLSKILETFLMEGVGFVDYSFAGHDIRAFFKELRTDFNHDVRIFVANAVSMEDLKTFYEDFSRFEYFVVLPVTVIAVAVASYLIALLATRKIKKQSDAVNDFIGTVLENTTNMSASATEMEKIAENNFEIAQKLTEITQNFATSAEEGRYEINTTVKSIGAFLDLLQRVNSEISHSVELIESLNDLNDRITYLSDMISVLAINASIESSKERIDREGIAKIVEHITRIAKEARETSKITKKTIDSIQKSLSQLALYSERVKKEGDAIRSAIENISKVMNDFVEGINQIKFASENLRTSSEETTTGVEDMVKTLQDLRSDIDRLRDMMRELKI